MKITQLTPRNEHTVAAPSEQHLSVLNAKSFLEFCFFFYLSNFHLQHFGLFSKTFLIHQGAPRSQILNIHDYKRLCIRIGHYGAIQMLYYLLLLLYSNHFALTVTVNFHFQSLA